MKKKFLKNWIKSFFSTVRITRITIVNNKRIINEEEKERISKELSEVFEKVDEVFGSMDKLFRSIK